MYLRLHMPAGTNSSAAGAVIFSAAMHVGQPLKLELFPLELQIIRITRSEQPGVRNIRSFLEQIYETLEKRPYVKTDKEGVNHLHKFASALGTARDVLLICVQSSTLEAYVSDETGAFDEPYQHLIWAQEALEAFCLKMKHFAETGSTQVPASVPS